MLEPLFVNLVSFTGATIKSGQWRYADNNGVIVAEHALPLA
ncbi:hypothetical protein ACGK9R_09575 [Halomonas sp. HNIBRBA4712]